MEYETGNLFDPSLPDPPDIRLFTANGVLKKNGELVMGAGAAKAAKQLDPRAPAVLGRMLREGDFQYDEDRQAYVFGLLIAPELGLGAFQTKYHYRDKADPNLIALGAKKLGEFARANPDLRIAVNFPGVGLGRLPRKQVEALLEEFLWGVPVEVWSFSKGRFSRRVPVYHLRTRPRTGS